MLWESFRKGDRSAYAAIFSAHYDSLYRFGSKLTQDSVLLEDCIQELFLEIWQAKSRTPVLSVRAYLLKSLKYKLLKSFRHKGRIQAMPEYGEDVPFELSHEYFLIRREENEDRSRRVTGAIGRLTNRQREIIYLKYYQNLSYEEVCEIMDIKYPVARNLLYQAIKSLKQMLVGALEIFFFIF